MNEKGKAVSMTLIWTATIALAVLIVGGAIYFSRTAHREPSPPPAPVMAAAPSQTAKTSPAEEEEITPPPAVRPTAPAAPVSKQVGRPALQLDDLAGTLKLSVPVLAPSDRHLPLEYTCYRADISPPLQWTGAPKETKSFVLFLERRDPGKAPFLDWVVFNIAGSPGIGALPANIPARPPSSSPIRQAMSDQRVAKYSGPCIPRGIVNYAFRLFALDAVLSLPDGAPADDVIRAMNGHIIDESDAPFTHYFKF